MMTRLSFVLSLFVSVAAFAQGVDPLRNVSGTTATPGQPLWIATGDGTWTFFHGFDVHATYLSQTGPEEQENMVFSTNWLALGAQRTLGERSFVLVRGRVSLEPFTIEEESYPQFFQYVAPESGGPLIGRMRAQNLFSEAAVQFGWRPSPSTLVSVYGALAGQPALGPAPAYLRPSGVDFAEAPFAYDIQESFLDSTSVVTAGFATGRLALEASAFHDASNADPTEFDTGDIDSQSFRITLMPSANVSLQVSRGELGEEAPRTVTSGSITYARPAVAVTALWTRREHDAAVTGRLATETAYGFELALRGARNTIMLRGEHVDRPVFFPFLSETGTPNAATHFTAGYLFDLLASSRYRLGVGVNIDYRTQTHHLEDVYGHKPQGIYTFVRFRTGG